MLGDSRDGVEVEKELTKLAFVPSSDIADDASVAVDVEPGPPPDKLPTWKILSVDAMEPERDWKSDEVVEDVVSSDAGVKLLTDCCSLAFVSPDKLLLVNDCSSLEDFEIRWMFRRCFVRSPMEIIDDN